MLSTQIWRYRSCLVPHSCCSECAQLVRTCRQKRNFISYFLVVNPYSPLQFLFRFSEKGSMDFKTLEPYFNTLQLNYYHHHSTVPTFSWALVHTMFCPEHELRRLKRHSKYGLFFDAWSMPYTISLLHTEPSSSARISTYLVWLHCLYWFLITSRTVELVISKSKSVAC